MIVLVCGECGKEFVDSTALNTGRDFNREQGGCQHQLDVKEKEVKLEW